MQELCTVCKGIGFCKNTVYEKRGMKRRDTVKEKKLGLLPRLVIAIAAGILIGSFLPEGIVRLLATFNNIFGNFLSFMIPLIIIGFIVPGIADLGIGAGKLLALTAGIAYCSTIIAGTVAYGVDTALFPSLLNLSKDTFDMLTAESISAAPYVKVEMPAIMEVMSALVFSFVMGLGIAVCKADGLKKVFDEFQKIVSGVISGIIIPLLPIYVCGVFADMAFAGTVFSVLGVFIKVFAVVIVLQLCMILVQYLLAGTYAGKNPFSLIKNMLPAYATAIGTQSSAATIPVTLDCTKKNNVQNKIADFVIPLCATIHLAGSTITLTSCSLAVCMIFGLEHGFLSIYLPFILMLGVTMVAAPGVPGGAVMAALGLLSTMLGFDESLCSLMIALYLAQDSFGTACNVTGDGAIAVLVDAITRRRDKKEQQAG